MPHRRTGPTTYTNSYALRHNQTEEESRLWIFLRSHRLSNVHFRRQHAIGSYIVDFCAPRLKLVIEVDGGQHVDQEEYDVERTAYLESKGFRVLRFWNNEVRSNIEEVLDQISRTIEAIQGKETPSQPPPKSQSGF
jgi:very-short-patch-repair endonuclease